MTCRPLEPGEYDHLWDDDDEDEPEDDFDCMMMDDGTCLKAGSEECEFECPYRRDDEEKE